jgi:chemotaxis methyl-accepting protein methylase
MRPKNSKKKLVKSQFYYYRFLSLVTVIYLQLVLLYIHSSREIKILKLIKVLLQKNGFIFYAVSLLK